MHSRGSPRQAECALDVVLRVGDAHKGNADRCADETMRVDRLERLAHDMVPLLFYDLRVPHGNAAYLGIGLNYKNWAICLIYVSTALLYSNQHIIDKPYCHALSYISLYITKAYV
jgi:hypothetical protein